MKFSAVSRMLSFFAVLAACIMPFSGCLFHYRTEEQSGTMPREIVERERSLLLLRMQDWEAELRVVYDRTEDAQLASERVGRLNRRLARGRQVLHMFDERLRRQDLMIVFSREEWRQAMYVGCQRYR